MHSNNFNILSQTSVTSVFSPKYIIFWPIDFFSWLKKTHSEKCLSKFLFKDNYRIRTARSQKSSFILFKLISSSLKKHPQFWKSFGVFGKSEKEYTCRNQHFSYSSKFLKNCKKFSISIFLKIASGTIYPQESRFILRSLLDFELVKILFFAHKRAGFSSIINIAAKMLWPLANFCSTGIGTTL